VSSEFKPGHPIVFWVFVILLTFAFYSGAKAMVTLDDCGEATASKSWKIWPGEWECN